MRFIALSSVEGEELPQSIPHYYHLFALFVGLSLYIQGLVITFVGMNKAITGDLGLYYVIGYYQVLRKVRARVKGLKQGHFWTVGLLGFNPEGLRICEVRMIEPSLHRTTILQRFVFAMNAGLVVKDGRTYILSDKGRTAFEALQQESNAKASEITERIASQVKKRIKRAA